MPELYEYYYRELREYGFHFGDDVAEPMRTFGYAHGWIACFVKFHVPEKRQHIFFQMLDTMEDEQFRKLVRKFAYEDWNRDNLEKNE